MSYLALAEIRLNLGALTAQAEPGSRFSLLDALHGTIKDLASLREKLFKKKVPPPPSLTKEEIIVMAMASVGLVEETTPVLVRTPEPFEIPNTPARARRIPASTTYNAERYLPYRILWAKVIIRATYDYALWKDSKDMRLRKFALDAERWLFEPSDLELSFENICFAFDFPVEKIRQRTRALTKQDVKKLEFRERQGRSDMLGDVSGGIHK